MPVDWGRLRRHAAVQADLLTRAQCLEAGMGPEAIRWRVASGRWVRHHPGVYLTKPGRADWHVRAVAALLTAGSSTVVADVAFRGSAAAYLWGLDRTAPRRIDLTVPATRALAAPRGVSVTRSRRFDEIVDDLAYPWRTTPSATAIDLAEAGTSQDAVAVVARAVHQELVTPGQLRQELAARGRHRHRRLLLAALDAVEDGGQSGAELLYVRDVEAAHGLPRGVRQAPSDVGGRRYHDHGYAEFGLIVEVDGRLGHERWEDRIRDGRRDRQLLGTEQVTTRLFWPDVAVHPCQTAGELAAIFRTRGWRGRPRPCRRARCAIRALG